MILDCARCSLGPESSHKQSLAQRATETKSLARARARARASLSGANRVSCQLSELQSSCGRNGVSVHNKFHRISCCQVLTTSCGVNPRRAAAATRFFFFLVEGKIFGNYVLFIASFVRLKARLQSATGSKRRPQTLPQSKQLNAPDFYISYYLLLFLL